LFGALEDHQQNKLKRHQYGSNIMNGKTASLFFAAVCLALAILSLAGVIAPLVAGGVFAGALVFFGGFSLAFRRHRKMTEQEEEEREA
jgi:hypothetical protein